MVEPGSFRCGRQVQAMSGSVFPAAIAQRLDLDFQLAAGQTAVPVLAALEGERKRTGIVLATAGGQVQKLPDLAPRAVAQHGLPTWRGEGVHAVFLLTLPRWKPASSAGFEQECHAMLYKVTKMSCGHCVRAVTEAVHGVDASARVDVDLKAGEVRVESAFEGAAERIARAISAAGYDATLVRAAA